MAHRNNLKLNILGKKKGRKKTRKKWKKITTKVKLKKWKEEAWRPVPLKFLPQKNKNKNKIKIEWVQLYSLYIISSCFPKQNCTGLILIGGIGKGDGFWHRYSWNQLSIYSKLLTYGEFDSIHILRMYIYGVHIRFLSPLKYTSVVLKAHTHSLSQRAF